MIPWDQLLQGGAGVLLAFVLVLIFTGLLVPVRTVRQLERDRDHWRQAYEKAMGQADALMPGAQIASEVVKALGAATAVRPAEE